MSAGAQVIVFPRGQLTAKDKERLSKVGVVAVEADDPSKVVSMVPGSRFVTGDDLLMSSLYAVVKGYEGGTFATELYGRLKKREETSQQQGPAPDKTGKDGQSSKGDR